MRSSAPPTRLAPPCVGLSLLLFGLVSVVQRLGEFGDDADERHRGECLGGEGDELEIGALVALDVFEESDKEIVSGCEICIDRGVRRHERPSLSRTVQWPKFGEPRRVPNKMKSRESSLRPLLAKLPSVILSGLHPQCTPVVNGQRGARLWSSLGSGLLGW